MTITYFDCFSGISGDMVISAFIDLGVSLEWLREHISRMPLTGFDLSIAPVSRHGIAAKQFHVSVKEDAIHRSYSDIISLIKKSPLSSYVKKISLSIFDRIAEAESQIHSMAKESVHFHEVGGLDSIIDIVGTALCLEYLEVEKVISSKLPLGQGFVTCRHGVLPVPAPATVEILRGIPVVGSGLEAELVTPTGAAIVAELADTFVELPEMMIEKIGYGAGARDMDNRPNLLRIIIGQAIETMEEVDRNLSRDTVMMIETCVDDMNPEIFGFLMESLFADGALDVYWVPVFMKKNRPGTCIQVLCRLNDKQTIINRILSETTSTGVRFHHYHRQTLRRETVMLSTEYGDIPVKKITDTDGQVRLVPEYEVCKKIALQYDIPIRKVYQNISK